MTPFLLISRSAEYETRMRALLGDRLAVVPGEFLLLGPEIVIGRVKGTPRIALLGPVLNFEETRGLVLGLKERFSDVGVIVVREQRTDLEDWVDDLPLHAVLSPQASDTTTQQLLERLHAQAGIHSASQLVLPDRQVEDAAQERHARQQRRVDRPKPALESG